MGFFESSNYIDGIFPSIKVQKPGYDLYGSTTSVLFFMLVFVLLFYKQFTVDPKVFEFMEGQSEIFKGEQGILLSLIAFIMVVERIANRTDTKADEETKKQKKIDGEGQKIFNNDDMFKRTSTARSMTVKLKTMKT